MHVDRAAVVLIIRFRDLSVGIDLRGNRKVTIAEQTGIDEPCTGGDGCLIAGRNVR